MSCTWYLVRSVLHTPVNNMKVTSSGIRKLIAAMMMVILRSYRRLRRKEGMGFFGRKGWVAEEGWRFVLRFKISSFVSVIK
jgi:hypothetical protein